MRIIPWITIGLNILILSIIANGNSYKLEYVHVMFDYGQIKPNPIHAGSELGISDWKLSSGDITETTENAIRKFAKDFFNKYSHFVGATKDHDNYNFGNIDNLYGKFAIYQLMYSYLDDPHTFVEKFETNGGGLNADYRCSKRNILIEMARYGSMTDAEKDQFIMLIKDMRALTREDVTEWNHLEYIKELVVEVSLFNSTRVVDFLAKHKDIILKSIKISMGWVDKPIKQGNITIDEEIRQSRVQKPFWYALGKLTGKANCVKDRTRCYYNRKLKLGAYATTATTINSVLMGFGLTTHINQSIDFYPKAGSNLVIELYAKADKSSYFKVLLSRDGADAYKDLTKVVTGCDATEYCDVAVLHTLYRPYDYSQHFNCTYDSSQYFVPVKSTTTSTSDNCNCKTTDCPMFNFF